MSGETLEKLLTIHEVADQLGVHIDTVRKHGIPYTKVGRLRRYHPKAVERWLRDHSPRPEAWAKGTAA